MKFVPPELEFGHLLVGNLQARRIGIVSSLLFTTSQRRGSGGNKVDDDFVTDERLPASSG